MGDSGEGIAPETDKQQPKSAGQGVAKSSPTKSPKMDSKQLARVKSSLMTRKEKLLEAKEEEKNFVEFRKKQILFECRPKSQSTARSKSDDSFPRKKRGVSMGFGEMKAQLLGIRPDPKYATWFGKKTPQKEKKKLSLLPGKKSSPKKPSLEKIVDVKSMYVNPIDEDEPVVRKGNRDGRPLDVNGTPFWMNSKPEEDTDEDDCIVNIEVVEKALKEELKLEDYVQRKGPFDYAANIDAMKKWDRRFEKKCIFSNTIRTVVDLAEDKNRTSKTIQLDPQSIKWTDTMEKTSYNYATAKSEWKTDKVPLMNVVKE